MDKALLKSLEDAAAVLMAPPNLISHEQRQNAESVLLGFRKTKTPYIICQQILENSSVELVMFEAADILKTAVIVEWKLISDNDKQLLRQYLLNFVLNSGLPSSVREKLLQVIAIMIKRLSIEDFGSELNRIIEEGQKMIKSGDMNKQIVTCSMIRSILDEYLNTYKSVDTGLTFEEHFKAKKFFENTELRKIFVMILQSIQEFIKVFDGSNTVHFYLMKLFLDIMEIILTWNFLSINMPKKMIPMYESAAKTNAPIELKLSAQWENVIKNPMLLDIFFELYFKLRENEILQPKAVTCLVQLSTLSCTAIKTNSNDYLNYFLKYATHFVPLLSGPIKESEAIGFSKIIKKLFSFYKSNNNANIMPPELYPTLISHTFTLTNKYISCSANENIDCEAYNIYFDALENTLESWLLILQSKDSYQKEVVSQYITQIFNNYVQSHLAPPFGLRSPNVEEAEIDEIEESDRERFKDQLIIIGYIGREILPNVLPNLVKLIEDKVHILSAELQYLHASSTANTTALHELFEDLHWIILILGNLLALEIDSELALIPSEINDFSKNEISNGSTDVTNSLKVLASPNLNITDIPNAENNADLVIRIIAACFRYCELEKNATLVGMDQFLSPELSSTLMWFLKIWTDSYLLPSTENYSSLSPCFQLAFAGDGGKFTVDYIVRKICLNLQKFSAEAGVIKDTVDLFLGILKRNHRSYAVFTSEVYKEVVELRDLDVPVSVKKSLMKGYVLVASIIDNKGIKQQYLNQFLVPIVNRYTEITCDEDFRSNFQNETIKCEIIGILEEARGCVQGCQVLSAPMVYNTLKPLFTELPNLCDLYNNYCVIVDLILELLCDVISNFVHIIEEQYIRQSIYQCCIYVVQVYVNHNSNRFSRAAGIEDENVQDILLLLKIFNYLLIQSMIVSQDDTGDALLDSSDVCIAGLNLVSPMITVDLFKYPNVCYQYYCTITLFVETKTHALRSVSQNFIEYLLNAVKLGLTHFTPEIQSKCLEFLQEFGNAVFFNQDENAFIAIALKPFLKDLLDMIFTQQIDSDNKTDCNSALFVLICCFKNEFTGLMKQFIQAHTHSNPDNFTHLTTQLDWLMSQIQFVNQRTMRNKFVDLFEKFLSNVYYIYQV